MVDMVDILNTLRVNHVAYGATYARWGVTNRATRSLLRTAGGARSEHGPRLDRSWPAPRPRRGACWRRD